MIACSYASALWIRLPGCRPPVFDTEGCPALAWSGSGKVPALLDRGYAPPPSFEDDPNLGDDADEVMGVVNKHGITRKLAKEAIEVAQRQGGLTIFAVVDAFTSIAGELSNAGHSTEADQRVSSLLALAVEA